MQKGQRFSQLYLDKGRPVNDSERMRNRISAYYVQNLYKFNGEIAAEETAQERFGEVNKSFRLPLPQQRCPCLVSIMLEHIIQSDQAMKNGRTQFRYLQ